MNSFMPGCDGPRPACEVCADMGRIYAVGILTPTGLPEIVLCPEGCEAVDRVRKIAAERRAARAAKVFQANWPTIEQCEAAWERL